MKTALVLVLLLVSFAAYSDGPIAVAPSSDPASTWQFIGIKVIPSTPPSVVISVVWLTQSGRDAQLDTDLYPREITLVGAEIVSFLAAISPAGTDSFSATAGAAKRFRQRASRWLIDNGKIARGGNES